MLKIKALWLHNHLWICLFNLDWLSIQLFALNIYNIMPSEAFNHETPWIKHMCLSLLPSCCSLLVQSYLLLHWSSKRTTSDRELVDEHWWQFTFCSCSTNPYLPLRFAAICGAVRCVTHHPALGGELSRRPDAKQAHGNNNARWWYTGPIYIVQSNDPFSLPINMVMRKTTPRYVEVQPVDPPLSCSYRTAWGFTLMGGALSCRASLHRSRA